MYGMYHTFNFMTGYTHHNPTVQSIEWRLIVLESVAGVPGFVAAGKIQDTMSIIIPQIRHFDCLTDQSYTYTIF